MGHLDLLKLYEPHFPSCLARKQSNWRPKKEHQGQRPLEDMWMLAKSDEKQELCIRSDDRNHYERHP